MRCFSFLLNLTFLVFSILLTDVLCAENTQAQTDIVIRGSGRLIPVAMPRLCILSGSSEPSREIPKIMQRDLDLSGYFEVIDPGAYVESPGKCSGFSYSDWSVLGTEGLVRGEIEQSGTRLKVRMYLHDVPKQKTVVAKEYDIEPGDFPRVAHRFSNEVMRFFTGTTGPFGSQIAYSGRVGRFKELWVMDLDGAGQRQVTDEKGLAVSPSWNVAGDKLIYTSYRRRVPDLYVLDVFSRRTTQVTADSALELGAQFGPSNLLLASRTAEKDSDIVMLSEKGEVTQRLTKNFGTINVSPRWSPDFSKITFCSNRSGGPQIYVMSAAGSQPERASYVDSKYCTSPAWSPLGDRIAFVCRIEGRFQIFTSKPNGSDEQQLTSVGDNEDPDWSPDGRYLIFASTLGRGPIFQLAMMRSDGSGTRQLTNVRGGAFEPSWGPIQAG